MARRIQRQQKMEVLMKTQAGEYQQTSVTVVEDTGQVKNSFKVFWVLNAEAWGVLMACYNPEEVVRVMSLLPKVKDRTYVLRRDDHNNMTLVDLEAHFALSRNIWSKFIKKLLANDIIKIIVERGFVRNSISYRIVLNPYLMNRGPVSDNVIMQFTDISKGLPDLPIPRDMRHLAKSVFDINA